MSGVRRLGVAVVVAALFAGSAGPAAARPVTFTWLGVTHWLVETPAGALLLDAYVSRPPFDASRGTNDAGLALLRKLVRVAKPGKIRWIVVGHSHFDHAIDVGPLAEETGALVIGSATTCRIAEAQGLPAARCRAVGGGERLEFGRLEMQVVRVVHSGPDSIGRYAVLQQPPQPSNLSIAPNGGTIGVRFRLRNAHGATQADWFWSNSIAAIDSDDGSGVDFRAVLAELFADGMGTDVWLGAPFGGASVLGPYLDVIRPRTFVPQHWDGIAPILANGLAGPFAAGDLQDALDARSVTLVPQRQYFEKLKLARGRVVRVRNRRVQKAFGVRPG